MQDSHSKLERAKALKTGRGIQNLLNAAYEILGNPIVMFNTEYTLQAYTNVETDDPIWHEILRLGTFSHETQVLFAQEGFVDEVANATTTAFLTSDKMKYDRFSGKIHNEDRIHVANLNMVASSKPFEEGDEAVFTAVCDAFSREIGKSEFYQKYGRTYRETYIRKLIDGELEEKTLYAAHIAIVYTGFEASMRLVVADIGQNNPDYSKLAHFRDLFMSACEKFEYAVYANHIVIIINANEGEAFDAKRDLEALYPLCVDSGIGLGVSSCFDNMYELKTYYDEAVHALRRGGRSQDGERIFVYDQMDSAGNPA